MPRKRPARRSCTAISTTSAPNGGVSGVLVLAESHISIHTWPERDFAAVDIFMCGACNPYHSLPVLKEVFAPKSILLSEQRRGLIRVICRGDR